MVNIEDYYRWNEQLRLKYEMLWPEAAYHIWDGVVSPKDYAGSPLKVMFLNKESFDDPENGGYDISLGMAKEILEGKPILGGENSTMMMTTKNRLAVLKLLEGDIKNVDSTEIGSIIRDFSTDRFRKEMLKVAYCNIKKSSGKSKSEKRDLRLNFRRNREIIEEQISYFNPTLIVGGNIFDGIIENEIEWGENLYISESHYINIFQLKIKDKIYPYIDAYHPAMPKLKNEENQKKDSLELFRALLYVEQHHPYFWKNRCGLKCFNND